MAQSGDRVGEYVLDARVGGGTFGEVWRAHHHVWTDQLVAIKIPTDSQYLRNLQREGVAIHGLVHPNIVRAMGFDPYAPVPYLTMEFIPGTSLRPMIQNRTLSISDAVAAMRQVLSGLKYAHEHQVIHRDVKPENILVHERALRDGFNVDGVVKVTDFGLGSAVQATAGSIAYSASMNSPEGREIAGTLDYMAPEQRLGGTVDARADLYSCGVVMYELLTGERPAGTEVPSDLNKAVPKSLDDVFRRSYARLDKRYASAQDFLTGLASVSVIVPPPIPPIPPLPPRVTPWTPANANRGRCPQCRKATEPTDQFCMHCGIQLVDTVRRCGRCGAYPEMTDRYCIFCGGTLQDQKVTA
jgi:serine/threonine protein kinase